MLPEFVACDLWYPDESPHARVRICTVDGAEWEAFTRWARAVGIAFPEQLPIMLRSAERNGLQSVMDSLDWDAVPADALGCVATLSEFLWQANLQDAGVAVEAH